MEPMARIELATSPLPRECSATELHGQALLLLENTLHYILFQSCSGAGEGNRTLVVSLEGFCSTIELHPRLAVIRIEATKPTHTEPVISPQFLHKPFNGSVYNIHSLFGGGGRIRTFEGRAVRFTV